MHFLAYGWLGICAGIGGLMRLITSRRSCPTRSSAASSTCSPPRFWECQLGGGRGSILGMLLGVALIAVTQNGLNLLGISSYAFDMVIGAVILVAITTTNLKLGGPPVRQGSAP